MGLIIQETQKTISEVVGFTCDKCGKVYYDFLEMQELMYWHSVGGYSSVWGDGNEVEIVLCQYCSKELLGPYMRING